MRVLQSQIAMTPRGSYRSALDKHLNETRRHASRVSDRLSELGAGSNPVTAVIGFWEDMLGPGARWARRRWISCAAPVARRRCSAPPGRRARCPASLRPRAR